MGMKSPEEYREDARLVRALAVRGDKEDARHSLLGLADLLEYFARRAETHPSDHLQIPLSQSPTPTPTVL